jgi:hypothetical protein
VCVCVCVYSPSFSGFLYGPCRIKIKWAISSAHNFLLAHFSCSVLFCYCCSLLLMIFCFCWVRLIYVRCGRIRSPFTNECEIQISTPLTTTTRTYSVQTCISPGNRNFCAHVVSANVLKKTPWSESASELYRPSDRRVSAKLLPTFAPYSRFSRQEPLLFYQVAPQLYSRGWVDSVSDPLLFFLVVPGIEPWPPNL